MALVVQKFGGTSVGSPERIQAVAARIAATYRQGHRLVVVVSAMGDTTDDLIQLAHRVSADPPHREMDMLLTAGERISMALLSMALADRQVDAISFTGSQSGIITDRRHRRARIRRILGDRVRAATAENRVAIVAGFQGVSENREITTLGRGGSDTTAVALAAVLKADLCEIYTDVDGVYSADPRLVPGARLWSKIPNALMVELATRGAGVLHPRSVELAGQFGVNLRVRNSLNETEGTEVNNETPGMEEFRVVGVTSDLERVLLTVDLARPTAIGSIWDLATEAQLSVLNPVFADARVRFYAERDAIGEWKKRLERRVAEGFVEKYQIDEDIIPVSVVGNRLGQDGTALQQILDTLARNHILVTVGSATALAITVAVPRTHAEDAVKALHEQFFGPGG